mgnify:CR=1 FL=1
MFLQIRGGLGDIESKIRTIQSQENLSDQQKRSRIVALKSQAITLIQEADSNFTELSSLGANDQVLANASSEISHIQTIKSVIDSLGLVEVEIDFADIFGSRNSLKKLKKIDQR